MSALNVLEQLVANLARLDTNITSIDTPMLKSMRDLCPSEANGSVELGTLGHKAKLTLKTRQAIDAELKRRKASR